MKKKRCINLPSPTAGGGRSRNTAISNKIVTRSSTGKVNTKRRPGSTDVTPKKSNTTNIAKKPRVLPLVSQDKKDMHDSNEKNKVKSIMEISNDMFVSAKQVQQDIELEKEKELTKKIVSTVSDVSKEVVSNDKAAPDDAAAEKETPTVGDKKLEDEEFLQANASVRELLLKIEDMVVDYRNSNVHTMNDDNQSFQAETENMLLSSFGSIKTTNMYQRYQRGWVSYALEHKVNKKTPKDLLDQHLLAYFVNVGKEYAPSTLYVIYSCINHYAITNYGFKLDTMFRLQRFLKLNTSTYVCKKSKVFSSEQMDIVLKYCMASRKESDNLLGVGIALMYYGLLRVCDAKKIQLQDVSHDQQGRVIVKFEHSRKRKNPGFTYHIPSIYGKLFNRYESELPTDRASDMQYLRLFHKGLGLRKNPAGPKTLNSFVKSACEILHLDPKNYTSHCFRRSAATNLADAGVSFINLKRHGQWKSDSVAKAYIANSKILRQEREICLLPPALRETYLSNKKEQPKHAPFELLTPPDSTQGTNSMLFSQQDLSFLDKGDDDISIVDLNDPPLVDLISPANKKAKKRNKTSKNKQDKVAPGSTHGFFDAENEVVFVKTTQSEELEEDDSYVKVEHVVSAAAVPNPDLVQSGTFNFETSSSSFGTIMNSLTGGPNKTNFVNCVFNFKS